MINTADIITAIERRTGILFLFNFLTAAKKAKTHTANAVHPPIDFVKNNVTDENTMHKTAVISVKSFFLSLTLCAIVPQQRIIIIARYSASILGDIKGENALFLFMNSSAKE